MKSSLVLVLLLSLTSLVLSAPLATITATPSPSYVYSPSNTPAPTCKFTIGDVWRGDYSKNTLVPGLSQSPFTMTFGDQLSVLDANNQFVRFSTWTQVNQQILIQDLASAPPGNNCSSTTIGTYGLIWNNNCNQVVLKFQSDSCKTRFPLYDNVSLYEYQSCANNIISEGSRIVIPMMEILISLFLISCMLICMSH